MCASYLYVCISVMTISCSFSVTLYLCHSYWQQCQQLCVRSFCLPFSHTYLLNQIRLFFPLSLALSISLTLVYFMPLLHTYLFVQKTLWQFYQHAMHREKTRCTIWMQPSEMRVEPNRLKLFGNRFCLHPNPMCTPHQRFIHIFWLDWERLCFMVNLWRAYQCCCIQLQLLCSVRGRVRGRRYTKLWI